MKDAPSYRSSSGAEGFRLVSINGVAQTGCRGLKVCAIKRDKFPLPAVRVELL